MRQRNSIRQYSCKVLQPCIRKEFVRMAKKIKIISDSTSDLPKELLEQYQIEIVPLIVSLGNDALLDGVTVFPDDLYRYYQETRQLPKTAAPSPAAFGDRFRYWTDWGYAVICFTISSEFSASYANAKIAAADYPDVFVIDSRNLTTGIGLLVLRAAELAAQGLAAGDVFDEVQAMREKIRASFVIDTLQYLWKGGRCSGVTALGANLLHLRPCIEVENGKMNVTKKYRGTLEACVLNYFDDKLAGRTDIDLSRAFLTHSGMSNESMIKTARKHILRLQKFDQLIVARAGSTISTHCGPNTMSIVFAVR